MEQLQEELTRLGYKVLTRVSCGVEQALPGEAAAKGGVGAAAPRPPASWQMATTRCRLTRTSNGGGRRGRVGSARLFCCLVLTCGTAAGRQPHRRRTAASVFNANLRA